MEARREYIIIDPTSPEPNRGSFCYLPYLLTNALSQYSNAYLFEDFSLPQLDALEQDRAVIGSKAKILVALWSYPQIDLCLYLHRYFKGKAEFFGYYPLIEKLGLPAYYYTEQQIKVGMRTYPGRYDKYKHLLLSDCDEHIRGKDGVPITMYPMFTSYGCPNGCKFCSATVNNKRRRTVLPICDVLEMLQECVLSGRTNIHFTDEDFFYDSRRTFVILYAAHLMQKEHNVKWQFIALAHMRSLERFVDYLESNTDATTRQAVWDTLKLVEVGLESASAALAGQMGKRTEKDKIDPSVLHFRCPVPILWLTMTFFPGETIHTLNETGKFLAGHGLSLTQMSPRLATNGTWGGLGQFFQYYDGCGFTAEDLKKEGVVLCNRPVRLIPSFVPYSFLRSKFYYDRSRMLEVQDVFSVYTDMYAVEHRDVVNVVSHYLPGDLATPMEIIDVLKAQGNVTKTTDVCIALAIMARLEIIKGV